MFKADDFNYIDKPPAVGRRVRGWDLAATDDGAAAYTVGLLMCLTPEGRLVIEDVERGQWSPHVVEQKIRACAEKDGPGVEIDLPQDPGQSGKAQVRRLIALLNGHLAYSSPESGSKEDRARPLAAQCEGGNVDLVRAPWNQAFVTEAAVFPAGKFKDQIDAGSRAHARLIMKRTRSTGAAPTVVGG